MTCKIAPPRLNTLGCLIASFFVYAGLPHSILCAQADEGSISSIDVPTHQPSADGQPVVVRREFIEEQIRSLSRSSYRTRQLARWRLEQYPLQTLDAIADHLGDVEYNTGAQLIDLLSSLAMHSDLAISVKSRELLQKNANRVSSLGRLADNAIRAIADVQEEQSLEVLLHHGARVGMQDMLGFNLNGREKNGPELALWIDDHYDGDEQSVERIQFLKSIVTVCLEGSKINTRHFRAIAKLSNLQNVKIKRATITKSDLELLKSLTSLELLELDYVDVGDEILATLAELPISQSLRLYGTRISPAAVKNLTQQLDGITIYCGLGGFLGVGTQPSDTVVTQIVPGSGADLAGILRGDKLSKIDDIEIKNFADLRTELGKHIAGDKIKVSLTRTLAPTETIELDVVVTLSEDQS